MRQDTKVHISESLRWNSSQNPSACPRPIQFMNQPCFFHMDHIMGACQVQSSNPDAHESCHQAYAIHSRNQRRVPDLRCGKAIEFADFLQSTIHEMKSLKKQWGKILGRASLGICLQQGFQKTYVTLIRGRPAINTSWSSTNKNLN